MNNLINIENKEGTLLVSSREVAERFSKEHYHVVDAIESKIKNLTHENSGVKIETLFITGTFEHRGNKYKEYLLTRNGFSFIAMGFTGAKADVWRLKFIEAFNRMEEEIKRLNQPQGTELLALGILEAQKVIEAKNSLIEEQKPKVLLADSIMASNTSIPIGNLAKILRQNGINTGEKRLFEWMRTKGYLTKRKGKATSIPTQRSIEMGLLETKWVPYVKTDGSRKNYQKPMVTSKGQLYFINKLANKEAK